MLNNSYSKQQIKQRNLLLQECLRPDYSDIKISDQYPLILDENNSKHSYTILKNDKIISHANLQQRRLQGNKDLSVGLIGNVATAPEEQGNGHMKKLLKELESVAQKQGLNALILWSDLDKFYQNMGYKSLSLEYLFSFNRKKNKSAYQIEIKKYDMSDISNSKLEKWLSLRDPSIETISRSVEEFRKLLTIPETYIFDWKNLNQETSGYLIIGKGFDMVNVVHEWACKEANELVYTIREILEVYEMDQLRLLSPFYRNDKANTIFLQEADNYEKNPMAWIKPLDTTQKYNLEEMFIWGLDSI